jgi:hypothetical protein
MGWPTGNTTGRDTVSSTPYYQDDAVTLFGLPEMPLTTDPEVKPKTTERDLLNLLAQRYGVMSMGDSARYAYAEQVPSKTSWVTRRLDFMAMDMWPSAGLDLHGFEVKCSRSDWLVELRDPSKAEEFKQYMDRWWLVIADRAMVKPGELPEGWGLIALDKRGSLRTVTFAPRLTPAPMPKKMLAGLLRATQKTAQREAARCSR